MDFKLKGRTALVCGASKGLGFGCARALAMEGVNVVLVARGESALREAMRRIADETSSSVQVRYVVADIATARGRQDALAQGHYDIVVTNAGGPPAGDFRTWTREDWLAAIETNMLAPIQLIQACIDGMATRGFGRIVNVTSSAVKAPIDILGLSNGARSGLTGFIAGIARSNEFASRNVTINNLLPGYFGTERLMATVRQWADRDARTFEETKQERLAAVPARRFGTPEEFGALCAFLCSDQAAYVTGQNILIDGGAFPGTF